MGIAISLASDEVDNGNPARALTLFIFDEAEGSYAVASFPDFVRHPVAYSSHILAIFEPLNGASPPTSNFPEPKPQSADFMRVVRHTFSWFKLQRDDGRVWLLAGFVPQPIVVNARDAARDFPFARFKAIAASLFDVGFSSLNDCVMGLPAVRLSVPLLGTGRRACRRSAPAPPPLQLPGARGSPRRMGGALVANTPNECDQITDGIFMGGESASHPDALKRNRITHVVSLASSAAQAPKLGPEYHHHVVALRDGEWEELPDGFWAAIRFVRGAVAAGARVLVHCRRGISRSATLVVAYLMETRRLSLEGAIQIVQCRRPSATINTSFGEQLREHYGDGSRPSTGSQGSAEGRVRRRRR